MRRMIIVTLTALFVFAQTAPVSLQQDADYSRESRAAIGAHHLCSGLWVVGRVYKRALEEVLAQDIAPFQAFGWEKSFTYTIDEKRRRVTVNGPGVPPRVAQYNGDQGCSILPRDAKDIYFKPARVPRKLPDAATQPWPTGDAGASAPVPDGVDVSAVQSALDWGLAQKEHNTRAIVLVYRGKIVGERYAPGWTKDTPQISWSEGKSITAALIGVLAQQGRLKVDDIAPVKEWQGKDDARRQIRIRDLLRMSSGLDFANLSLSGPASYTRENEHMRIYFDGVNVFEHAVNQPQEIPPNTQCRYRNSDPLVLGKIIRDMVEAPGPNGIETYLTFPQRALFDVIGARNFVLETDAWGNFIMTGYDYGSARDWARFGLLHLWDGVWEGKRLLPEGWVEFISTPAPADNTRGYGGLFWLNRGGAWRGLPEDTFMSSGFMGQHTVVIRSRDAVVVRMGPSPRDSTRYLTELVTRLLVGLPKK